MRHIAKIIVLPLLVFISQPAIASAGIVSNGNDDGVGSLRSALESGVSQIRISSNVSTIVLTKPLVHTGIKPLRIHGGGQTIDGSGIQGDGDILSITQGANTKIYNLSFIGNAADVNDDPSNPVGGKGIDITVPTSRKGLIKLHLNNVSVTRVGHHGVHVSDCSLGDACGSGSGGDGDGSAASIFVDLNSVTINKVGFGRADADGLRIDERGDGSIYFRANRSLFLNVGADGVELDEGNRGDIVTEVRNSVFDSNGEYCNTISIFEQGPCDDDGDRDVDDGFDIDEAGPGTLYASVRETDVTNNFDEGLDFDVEDDGGAQIVLSKVFASGNADEGVKVSEEGAGTVSVRLHALTTVDNNGGKEGVEIEEEGAGDVLVLVERTNMIGGDDEVLKIEQADLGEGIVYVRASNVILDLKNVTEY